MSNAFSLWLLIDCNADSTNVHCLHVSHIQHDKGRLSALPVATAISLNSLRDCDVTGCRLACHDRASRSG